MKPTSNWQEFPQFDTGIVIIGERELSFISRGREINSHARDKVIDFAVNRVDRNAAGFGPGFSIGGSAQNHIIRSATFAETTVGPDYVDLPCAIDLRRRQRAAAQVAVFRVKVDVGNCYGATPAFTAVRRREGNDTSIAVQSLDRHNHRAVGLNQRLAADAESLISRGFRSTPRKSAVGRRAHEDFVVRVGLVPLGVAVSVIGAGSCVVAGNPVLVVPGAAIDDDRLAPMNSVRRAADAYCLAIVWIGRNGQSRNQP